jgi:DNA-binding response OmpR family regulator
MKVESKKILVVDDEDKIVEVVKSYLENSGYSVFAAFNGIQALEMYEKVNPSLIILDLMLPDVSGEEILKTIRKRSSVPIIMLTAKVEEEDILKGLDIGADDYVTKPFSPRQLIARVGALLRRACGDTVPLSGVLSFNDGALIIDTLGYEVRKGQNVVSLTPVEYKLLLTMVKYPSKVFTREELITLVLGEDFEGYDRTIDTHIKNLRQKIEDDSKHPQYILTVHGVGYRFGGNDKWNREVIENIGINALENGLIVRVKDIEGNIVWDATVHNNGMCTQMLADIAKNMESRYKNFNGQYVENPYPLYKDSEQFGVVEIGYYGPFYFNDSDLDFINSLNKVLIVIGLFSLLLAIAFGTIMASRLSYPIIDRYLLFS